MTNDPTREEMLAFLAKYPFICEASEFDIEGAIYWFAYCWHNGQSSNLYSALSTSPFEPGPCCSGPEPESMESDLLAELESHYVN
jgi:hypothetical protein